jgi:hypothetical protein
LQALQDNREIGVDLVHRRLRRRGGRVQDVCRFPARGEVALGRQLTIERIQGQQLPNPGLLAGNHGQFVAIVRTDHPQATRQGQHEQEEQDLELARKAETPQQADTG